MKILVIGNNQKGMQVFRGLLLRRLTELGNRVTVAVPVDEDTGFFDLSGIGIKNISMDRRGKDPFKEFKLIIGLSRLIKADNYDLVITYTIKPNIYGGTIARWLSIPYAANITGLGTALESDGLLKKVAVRLYKTALKKAKAVFFENASNRDFFIDNGIIRSDQAKLLNGAGVDLEQFTYHPYSGHDRFRFLFVGRVMKEKGINELLTAAEMLADNGYDCVLDIVGWMEEDYSEIIKQKEAKGLVKYYGLQSDVRPFYADADCFVLPSWHEGMANTNLEAAATGRPVITSDIPGCKEAVIEGKTGFLFEKANVESLYAAMKKMMELSEDQRAGMGLEGRHHMERVFDKEKVVAETIECLKRRSPNLV